MNHKLRTLFLVLLSGISVTLFAQTYHVSTEQQPKQVLLEEFTGIYCGYCPDGHKIAAQLKEALRERMSVVAVHCGPFAPADNDANDLTVPEGEQLGQLLESVNGGFPNGSVNRRDWLGQRKCYYGRGFWEEFTHKVIHEKAPVNLWAKAELKSDTRELTLRVEGYWQEQLASGNPRLGIFLTQNNILAMQSGAFQGGKYNHQHVLRDALTTVNGEALSPAKPGTYFEKEYAVRLPKSYKKIAVAPADMELVVFVMDGELQVLNAITVKPQVIGDSLPLRAEIQAPRIEITGGYRYNFVPLEISNLCNTKLTQAMFDVQLNDEVSAAEWNGEILPFETREVRLPVDWNQKATKFNSYSITLKGLNGNMVEGNSFQGSFRSPVTLPQNMVLRLAVDDEAAANTYGLYDMDGTLLQEFGPFENGQRQTYEEKLSLAPNKRYCLEIKDRWGNGIQTFGSVFELMNETGFRMVQGTVMPYYGCRFFFDTGAPMGIEGVLSSVDIDSVEVFNLQGSKVGNSLAKTLPKGVYLVRKGLEFRKVYLP